jgi:hypothetical protein
VFEAISISADELKASKASIDTELLEVDGSEFS